jgi:hypothetical protein
MMHPHHHRITARGLGPAAASRSRRRVCLVDWTGGGSAKLAPENCPGARPFVRPTSWVTLVRSPQAWPRRAPHSSRARMVSEDGLQPLGPSVQLANRSREPANSRKSGRVVVRPALGIRWREKVGELCSMQHCDTAAAPPKTPGVCVCAEQPMMASGERQYPREEIGHCPIREGSMFHLLLR